MGIKEQKHHGDNIWQKNDGIFVKENRILRGLESKLFENNDKNLGNVNVVIFNTKINVRSRHKIFHSIQIMKNYLFWESFVYHDLN